MNRFSPLYYTLNVFDEDRFVLAADYPNKGQAIRESIAWQQEGLHTEIVTLSQAPVFESVSDFIEVEERLAY